MKSFNLCLLIFFMIGGCATVGVTQIKMATPKSPNCKLDIYTNEKEIKQDFDVLCLLDSRSGSSAFADKTVSGAINEAKPEACKCGADGLVISDSRSEGVTLAGWGQGYATIKAFKYTDDEMVASKVSEAAVPVSNQDAIKKAKKCQSKGGVWVNDACQIDIEETSAEAPQNRTDTSNNKTQQQASTKDSSAPQEKDYSKMTIQELRPFAQSGEVEAQYYLGYRLQGDGKMQEAKEWYIKAAKGGDLTAKAKLRQIKEEEQIGH